MNTRQLIDLLNCFPSIETYSADHVYVCMVYAHHENGVSDDIPVNPYYELVLNVAYEELNDHEWLCRIPLDQFALGVRHDLKFGFLDMSNRNFIRGDDDHLVKCQFLTTDNDDKVIVKRTTDRFWKTTTYLKYALNVQFVDTYEQLMSANA